MISKYWLILMHNLVAQSLSLTNFSFFPLQLILALFRKSQITLYYSVCVSDMD